MKASERFRGVFSNLFGFMRKTEGQDPTTTESNQNMSNDAEVMRILEAKTHYEVLNAAKNASPTEMKKSYLQLALRVHPDKNRSPQSETAFKKVSTAYSVLSNETERARYDWTLDTEQMFTAPKTDLPATRRRLSIIHRLVTFAKDHSWMTTVIGCLTCLWAHYCTVTSCLMFFTVILSYPSNYLYNYGYPIPHYPLHITTWQETSSLALIMLQNALYMTALSIVFVPAATWYLFSQVIPEWTESYEDWRRDWNSRQSDSFQFPWSRKKPGLRIDTETGKAYFRDDYGHDHDVTELLSQIAKRMYEEESRHNPNLTIHDFFMNMAVQQQREQQPTDVRPMAKEKDPTEVNTRTQRQKQARRKKR